MYKQQYIILFTDISLTDTCFNRQVDYQLFVHTLCLQTFCLQTLSTDFFADTLSTDTLSTDTLSTDTLSTDTLSTDTLSTDTLSTFLSKLYYTLVFPPLYYNVPQVLNSSYKNIFFTIVYCEPALHFLLKIFHTQTSARCYK